MQKDMISFKGVLLLFVIFGYASSAQLNSVLKPDDGKRLLQYFKAPFKDLETAYHAINGLKFYSQGGAIGTPEKESACKLAKTYDPKSLTSIFQASSIAIGASCKVDFSKEAISFVNEQVKESSDAITLYKAVKTLQNLKKKVDEAKVTDALLNAVKEDSSVFSSSLALLTAAGFTNPNLGTLLKSADIEDMAAQADEVDGRYLHFENDLMVTSTFLTSVFAVSEAMKQPPLISGEQIILFTNYLLRSKTAVSAARDAAYLLKPLSKIVSSSSISLAKAEITSGSSISEENPQISVVVSNVFGQPMTKLTVKAESVTRSSDNEVVVSNQALKFDGLNSYNILLWKKNLKSGFYDVSLAVSSSSKLIGVSDLQFKVKATTKISLINIELGSIERESSGGSLKKIQSTDKVEQLKADNQQKVIMRFQVQDQNDKTLVSPHQAFVRFVNDKTGQEIIFVAEPDKELTFKFEVDLATGGREQFNSASGKYSMYLIVGDVSFANPVFWNFGNIVLQLTDEDVKTKASFEDQYKKKPEIHHLFRTPEKRPPQVVSQAFTVACLLPIGLLFLLWARIGANLNNFQPSIKSILFHGGLAGIFFLYYMFWTTWNMFTTIQYLVLLGALTFVFGNSVLSDIANNR